MRTTLEEKATFMEPGAEPMGHVTETGFNMLDFILCEPALLQSLERLHSLRKAVLRSDHFLVRAVLQMEGPRREGPHIADLIDKRKRRTCDGSMWAKRQIQHIEIGHRVGT